MRITYIAQYFHLPTESGSSRAFQQAKRMSAAGHEVHVVSSVVEESTTSGWRSIEVSGIHIHRYPVEYSNMMSNRQRIAAFMKFAYVSVVKARRLKGDLVFATSTPLTTAIPGVLSTVCPRRPLVFEVRDMWPDLPIAFGALKSPVVRSAARVLENVAYRHAEHIVALSPGMKSRILELSPRKKPVTVVPNASDVDFFRVSAEASRRWRDRHSGIAGDGPIAAYVGTIGTANRVDFLVDVAVELRRIGSAVRVLIVGGGKEESKVRALAEDTGCVGSNLFFMKRVTKDVVPLIYGAADVILSSLAPMQELESSSPNKVFEAFASGKPVAINYGGWVAETLKESGAGIVTSFDSKEFASALDAFVGDSHRLEKAGRASADLGQTKFNRDRLAGQVVRVVEQAAREFSRAHRATRSVISALSTTGANSQRI